MDQTYISLITILLTTVSAIWFLALWISRQFSNIRTLVYSENEKLRNQLINKIEYHEKHDDNRFAEIRNSIYETRNSVWEVRLNMAAKGMDERTKQNETRPE